MERPDIIFVAPLYREQTSSDERKFTAHKEQLLLQPVILDMHREVNKRWREMTAFWNEMLEENAWNQDVPSKRSQWED